MTAAEEMAATTATATVMATVATTMTARTTEKAARMKTMMNATATAVAVAFLPAAAMVILVVADLQKLVSRSLHTIKIIQICLGKN
jgi:hypothetical protein